MTTDRPGLYPYHDVTGTNVTWPENSSFLFTGYVDSVTPVPSADHNGKLNRAGFWHEYLDRNGIRNEDWIDTTVAALLSATSLTYNVGGNVLTTGATVSTRGVYSVNATRIATDAAFLNPVGGSVMGEPLVYPGATVPGRIWVYAGANGQPRYASVAAGTPDAPGANEISLIGLDVDALGVVTSGAVAPVTLPLPAQYLPITIDIFSSASIEAALVTANQIVVNGGVAGSPPLTVLPTAGESTVSITGDGTAPALVIPSTASTAISTNTSGPDNGVEINHTGSGAALLVAPTSTGRGIFVQSTSTGVGLRVDTSGGSGVAIEAVPPSGAIGVSSTTDTSAAVYGVATSTGVGVAALGGANAASLAVRGEASHVDAFGIQGLTAAAATTAAAGLLGSGRGAGTGVYATSSGTGYALVAAADTTSPVRAAMNLVPQNADPSTPAQGDFLFNSARTGTGKLRVRTTQWESVHSSARGWVKTWGAAAAGGPIAGGSGNLSLAQITPEEVGDVLVTATGSLEFSLDTNAATVTLVDVTSGVNIAVQTERAIDTDGVAPNVHSFAIRGIRTLPTTATRTFAVVLAPTAGTITYAHVICSVEGVQ